MIRRVLVALTLVGLLVVVVACWFLLLNPARQDISAFDQDIAAERARLAAAQAKLAQAESTREEGRKNQARLLELAKMVPVQAELPSLLLQIQELANQSGINFMAITPGDIIQAGSFQILPLELEFTGTYFDLSDFVYRVEQMASGPGRLLAVKQLRLQLSEQTGTTATTIVAGVSPELKINLTLYAFEMNPALTTAAQSESSASSEAASPATTTPGRQ
ncbi:MAG: type 4a pilus biogenesis protein PilO [Thermoleophilia bacterium]|nr:type 4a pilus biogenesis protein PilO [Thermoleophilia bacterium]